MSEFKKPSPSDTMIDHAEQHGFIYDEVNKLKSDKSDVDHVHDAVDLTHDHFGQYAGKLEFDNHNHDGEYSVDGHTHDTTHDHDNDYQAKGDYASLDHDHNQYVSFLDNSEVRPTAENRFITLSNRRPKEEDGTFLDKEFGLEINIDEGNTYKNQFVVGSRHGYALKVLGGGGKTIWIGGKIQQKGDNTDNLSPEDYIIRENLTSAIEEHTHDDDSFRKDFEALKTVVAGLQDAVNEIKDVLKLPK